MMNLVSNRMKYYNIIIILLIVIQSCNTTTLSKEELKNISNIQSEILIEDGTKRNSLNKINVVLSNGDKRISNDNIQVQLNGKPLKLYISTGNYYDKYPVYTTANLERSESYYFEIILPDSTKYPLAFIKPNKIKSEFNFPKNMYLDKDFVLNWKNNNMAADVEIWKGVHKKDNPNEHSRGRFAASTIHHSIKTESGSFKIPKIFYEDSSTIADYLEVRISNLQNGLINPELQANSKISYNYLLEKVIEFEK